MKMHYEITEQKETMLNCVKGKMLMKDNFLYLIEDFKIEEVTEDGGKTIFGRKRPNKVKLILTSITIRAYHGDGKFLGFMHADACERILIFFDLYSLHKVWLNFEEQLNAFGLEVKKIKKEWQKK